MPGCTLCRWRYGAITDHSAHSSYAKRKAEVPPAISGRRPRLRALSKHEHAQESAGVGAGSSNRHDFAAASEGSLTPALIAHIHALTARIHAASCPHGDHAPHGAATAVKRVVRLNSVYCSN